MRFWGGGREEWKGRDGRKHFRIHGKKLDDAVGFEAPKKEGESDIFIVIQNAFSLKE